MKCVASSLRFAQTLQLTFKRIVLALVVSAGQKH